MKKLVRCSVPFRKKSGNAFTLIELLVVLATVAVLASLTLPALTRAQGRNQQTQCANNLRQLTLANISYANDNRDRLPSATGFSSAWLWDTHPVITDGLVRYGALRQQFYCPSNPEQNVDIHWNFQPTVRVIGYSLALQGAASLIASNANRSLTPDQVFVGSVAFPAEPAAKRVLAADVTISLGSVTANKYTDRYTDIHGGSSVAHRSSHLDANGIFPTGDNVGMLDGHVEWRTFGDVVCRTGGGAPGFWW